MWEAFTHTHFAYVLDSLAMWEYFWEINENLWFSLGLWKVMKYFLLLLECVNVWCLLWTNLLDDHNVEHMFRGSLVYSTSLSIRFVCLISHSLSLVSFVYSLTKMGEKCIPHHVWYGMTHVWYRGERKCIPHHVWRNVPNVWVLYLFVFNEDIVLRGRILVLRGRKEFLPNCVKDLIESFNVNTFIHLR